MDDISVTTGQDFSPHSVEAERSIISCLLQDNTRVDEVLSVLSYEMFYDELYKAMFKSIGELRSDYIAIDNVTLKDKVVSKATLKDNIKNKLIEETKFDASILTDEFFIDLVRSTPIYSNVLDYASIVKEKYILRKTINLCSQVILDCRIGNKEVDAILNDAQDELFKYSKSNNKKDYIPIDEAIPEMLDFIEKASLSKDGITGLRTGFGCIDSLTAGLQNGNMIVVAARPGGGKTTLALNLAYNISKQNKYVMFFSLEMTVIELLMKITATETAISSTQLRKGRLSDKQWGDLIDATNRIHGTKLYIGDVQGLTISELRNRCLKLKSEDKLDIVMIDYLQLMHAGVNYKSGSGRQGFSNRQEEVAEISRSIKALAKELNVPIVAMAQLSRETERKKRPQLSDLRESGAIEQDADIVMFIYHGEPNDMEAEDSKRTEIIFAKNRNGEASSVFLKFDGATSKFSEFNK